MSLIRSNEFIYVKPLLNIFLWDSKLLIDIFLPVLNYIFEIFEKNMGFHGHYKKTSIETCAFFWSKSQSYHHRPRTMKCLTVLVQEHANFSFVFQTSCIKVHDLLIYRVFNVRKQHLSSRKLLSLFRTFNQNWLVTVILQIEKNSDYIFWIRKNIR